MSSDLDFVPSRPLEEWHAVVVKRGRHLRWRRRAALSSPALALVVALGATLLAQSGHHSSERVHMTGRPPATTVVPAPSPTPGPTVGGAAPVVTAPRSFGRSSGPAVSGSVPAGQRPSASVVASPGTGGPQRIAYVDDTSGNQIYLIGIDGKGRTRLSSPDDHDFFPAWSPNGQWIAFAGIGPGDAAASLYLMRPDGSSRTPLTHCSQASCAPSNPSWSPDGTKIAFWEGSADGSTCASNGDCASIYVINADGSGERRLGDGFYPSWSPDGTKIAFVSVDAAASQGSTGRSTCGNNVSNFEGCEGILSVMAADGTGAKRLGVAGTAPTWSPDGSRLAYQHLTQVYPQIFVMAADGTGSHAITDPTMASNQPAWSPDGSTIAFTQADVRQTEGVNPSGSCCLNDYEITIMKPDGSGVTRLTTEPGVHGWPSVEPRSR